MHPGTSLQFQFVAAECSEGKQSYLKKKKKKRAKCLQDNQGWLEGEKDESGARKLLSWC